MNDLIASIRAAELNELAAPIEADLVARVAESGAPGRNLRKWIATASEVAAQLQRRLDIAKADADYPGNQAGIVALIPMLCGILTPLLSAAPQLYESEAARILVDANQAASAVLLLQLPGEAA